MARYARFKSKNNPQSIIYVRTDAPIFFAPLEDETGRLIGGTEIAFEGSSENVIQVAENNDQVLAALDGH